MGLRSVMLPVLLLVIATPVGGHLIAPSSFTAQAAGERVSGQAPRLGNMGFPLDTVQTEEEKEKVFDPVCGMEIDKNSASTYVSEYDGKTYYFCSKLCKATFEKEPREFACFCGKGGHPECKCAHCQKAVARCECELASGGHEGGEHHHHHEEGEHHHH